MTKAPRPISFTIEGDQVRGFDRASGGHFEARVGEGVVQVFDHAQGTWFAYDVQDAARRELFAQRRRLARKLARLASAHCGRLRRPIAARR
jgi:hypothetical protein